MALYANSKPSFSLGGLTLPSSYPAHVGCTGSVAEPAGLQLSGTQLAALHMGSYALQPAHWAAPGWVPGHAGQLQRRRCSRDAHA